MGILKNLLVLGSAKFANVIKGTVEHAQNGIYYGTCSTAGATAAKVVTLDDPAGFELKPGVMIAVKFSVSNSAANATLNVANTGAKGIWYGTSAFTRANSWVNGAANKTFIYVYDGTYWVWVSKGDDTNSDTYTSAYCSTASATAAKAASCSGYYLVSALSKSYIHVIIVNSNTAASALTLNINSRGAKPIYINGSASSSTNYTLPAGSYIAFYDGTNYQFRTDGKLPGTIEKSAEASKLNVNDVGSMGKPVYFDDGLPVAGAFTWGIDDDQNVQVGWDGDTPEIVIPTSSALPVDSGGTGATTAAAARTNLGLGSAATYNVVSSLNNDSNLPTGSAIKTYVDAVGIPSAICTTSAATSAKTAVCSSFSLLAKSYIQVIIATANSANSALTLNINSTGAKPIFINGLASSSSNKTLPAGSYFVYYDGTNYYFRTDGKFTGDIIGTINGYSVNKDVPPKAVFTDTTSLANMTGVLGIAQGGTGGNDGRSALENLGLVVENYSFSVSGGIAAGTIGTRGAQQSVTNSYYSTHDLVSLTIVSCQDSNAYKVQAFAHGSTIYCNYYRAGTSAVSQANTAVTIRALFMKK